jgi:hypothetical protein
LIAKRDIRDFLSEKRVTIPDWQEEGNWRSAAPTLLRRARTLQKTAISSKG